MSDRLNTWGLAWLLLTVFLAVSLDAEGQGQRRNVEGTVLDTARGPLYGVTVRLYSMVDSLVTVTDERGKFSFDEVISREFRLTFSMLGFRILDRTYMVGQSYESLHILPVVIYPQQTLLDVVQISRVRPFVVMGDTIQYNFEAYDFSKNTLLEGALRKLPNVQVLRDGTVIAQGRRINRVQVDGKNFFGGDVLTATRNLHAEMIKSVQVIDYYGDVAEATGIQGGEPEKILNIVMHEDKRQILFGQVTGGGGTKERYIGSLGINNFNDGQELSVVASTNNTNTSLFSYGAPSGGGSRDLDGDLTGMTDGADGLNRINSLGLSFSDELSDRVDVYGRYAYTQRKNTTFSDLYLINGFQNYFIENLENKQVVSDQRSHQMSWDLDAELSAKSSLKISPTLSYSTLENQLNSTKLVRNRRVSSEGEYLTDGRSKSPNFGTELLYVRAFNKPRRKLVVSGNMEYFTTDRSELIGDYFVTVDSSWSQPRIDIYSLLQQSANDNSNRVGKIRAAFVEPISSKSVLEFSHEYRYTSIAHNRLVTDVEADHAIDSLGIDYHYDYQSHRTGLVFQVDQGPRFKYSLGIAAQPTRLEGYTLDRSIRTRHEHFNWVPSVNMRYKLSNESEVFLDYLGSNNQPSFYQMQPVRDLSNSQLIIVGNPELKTEFVNRFSSRIRASHMSRGQFFEAQVALSTVQDRIVSNRRTQPGSTTIETTFLNADGYYDLRSYYVFSSSLGRSERYQLNLNGTLDYLNNISYTNDAPHTVRHLIFVQGMQLRYSLEDRLNLELNGNYTMNRSRSELRTFNDVRAHSVQFGLAGRGYLSDDFSFGFDLSHRSNTGFSSFINSNPTLLNAYLEYTFLSNRRAMLRLQGLDIFNENTGVTREVYDTTDLMVRNNRLGRHFMLSLNIRLQRVPG